MEDEMKYSVRVEENEDRDLFVVTFWYGMQQKYEKAYSSLGLGTINDITCWIAFGRLD